MDGGLTEAVVATIKDAASKLTGAKRRAFQAQVALDYLEGNSRRAERVFGWGRHTVEVGLEELRTGVVRPDNFSARGNKKTEVKCPELEQDIRARVQVNGRLRHGVPSFADPGVCGYFGSRALNSASSRRWARSGSFCV